MMDHARRGLVAIALAWPAASLPSQTTVRLPAVPTCSQCRVDLQRVATLGTDSLDGYLANYPITASMDRSGRIYVALRPPGDLLLTFDTTGRFTGRVGRKGRGPAEFTFPVGALPRANGEILIWDFQLAILTTLDARHRYVRHIHQPNAPAAVLPDGRQLIVASMQDRNGVRYALHIYDDSGRRVDSFGAAAQVEDSERWRMMRTVAVNSSGTVWSAYQDQYRIEEWSRELRHVRTFTRDVSWMPRVVTRSDGVTGERPNALIVAMAEDDAGRLWVYSRVPSEAWQDALGTPERRPGQPTYYPQRDRGRLYDTMVDVIDLRRNALLVSQRVRAHVRFVLRPDLVAAYREDTSATPLLDIVRVNLIRP